MTRPNMPRLLLSLGLTVMPLLALAQAALDPALKADEFALHQEVVRHALDTEHMLYTRLIPLIFTLIMVVLAMLFLNQREKRRQELIARCLDKGQAISPQLLPPLPSAQRDRRLGTWMVGLGLGLGLALYLASGELRVAAWCLVPVFVGLAGFINAALFHRATDSPR